jgi:EAL domain-containing protein (putative c-di-GMP-specific phosphodiesterase class I)
VAVEALVRWQQPDGSLVAPDAFIGLAEETGLIVPLGSFVLGEACQQAQRWGSHVGAAVGVAVNLSPRQLAQRDLVDTVRRTLDANQLAAELLTLEVTESALVEVAESVTSLERLRELGVRIAIDDFGTRYSSLNYLRSLPVDVVKIDRSFVQALGTDRGANAIVSAVVTIADAHHLSVVAEGIETADQLEQLRQLGCHVGQGYYLARPTPAAELPDDIAPAGKRRSDVRS